MNAGDSVDGRPTVEGPAAWLGADLEAGRGWVHTFSPDEIADVESALARTERDRTALADLTVADFPLPRLASVFAQVRNELEDGLGLKLLRGFPAQHFTSHQLRTIFWGIGLHVGTAVSQSSRNDYLGDVRDLGTGLEGPRFRGYTSNGALTYHCDAADITALFCLRPAMQGGLSRIVSSVSIHNEIARTRPDLLDVLYEPYQWSMQGNELPGVPPFYSQPIFAVEDGYFACRYTRTHIRSAEMAADDERAIARQTEEQREALDLIDEVAARPEFNLTMMFEAGDIQFLNNHLTLHTRTAFDDHPEPQRKRHLLRLWLSLPNGRPLAKSFEVFFGDVRAGAVRGGFPGLGDPQFTTTT